MELLEPQFDDRLVPVASVSSYLSVGTFVQLDTKAVGRIIRTNSTKGTRIKASSEKDVTVNLFKAPADINFWAVDLLYSPLTNPGVRHCTELVQSTEVLVVDKDKIVRVVFVFHVSYLLETCAFISIQGMSIAFVIRYCSDGSKVRDDYCLPFPSHYPIFACHIGECYSSRVWRGIILLQQEIWKILGRVSEKQGLFANGKGKLLVSADVFHYIKKFCISQNVPIQPPHPVKRYKRRIDTGYSVKAVTMATEAIMIRFETASDMLCFRYLFGEFANSNIRKKRPRINDDPTSLQENDAINLVVGKEERGQFTRRTADDGIDFVFDGYELVIKIRYRRYLYKVNRIGTTVGCPCPVAVRLIQENGHDEQGHVANEDEESTLDDASEVVEIEEDSEFEFNGGLYRVQHLVNGGQAVSAICIHPPNRADAQLTFDNLDLVRDLIKERLN
jgi:hypothetical protein